MSTQFVAENGQPNAVLTATHGDPEPTDNRKSFQDQVLDFERGIIAEALVEAGGSVTRAARALKLTHQGLCYIINHRHKDLLTARTPIRVRRRSIIGKARSRRRPNRT
jgi:transcriptional regulator with PAS, ATPase and Fis domain